MLVRLQKVLADAGIASRRASETIITEGRVAVNGRIVRELGSKVDPAADRVAVDGTLIQQKRKLYVALNKPAGYISSRSDPEGRPVVGELLPKEWRGLYPVGRLDYNTEGLLFLTNDGEFSLRLTHPRYGVRKTYVATVEGSVQPELIRRLATGVYHEGDHLKADRARILSAGQRRSLVELELTEGKNREVRRLFESQGKTLERLERTQIGRIKLGELPSGKWRVLSSAEIASLLAPKQPSAPAAPRRSPQKSPRRER